MKKHGSQVGKLDQLKLKAIVLHDGIGKEIHMTQTVGFGATDLVGWAWWNLFAWTIWGLIPWAWVRRPVVMRSQLDELKLVDTICSVQIWKNFTEVENCEEEDEIEIF